MRRMTSIVLLLAFTLSLTSCAKPVDYKTYATEYRDQMLALNDLLNYSFELVGKNLVDYNAYNSLFSNEIYRNELVVYSDRIDDALYSLFMLAPRIEDKQILTYQSEIELALESINIELEKYLETKPLNIILPNRNVIYEETFVFLTRIEKHFNSLYENQHMLEDYLSEYLDTGFFDDLHKKRFKSQLRTSFTYNIIGIGIASSKEYTGLQIDYRMPVYIRHDRIYMTYEFSIGVIEQMNQFTDSMISSMESLDMSKVTDHDEALFKELTNLNQLTKQYKEIRSQYPYDFYVSGDFKEYQSLQYTTVLGQKYHGFEFNDDDTKLLDMKEAYVEILSLMYTSRLLNELF